MVPEITASAAYKADGLIAITFDQAPQTGPNADPSSCCDTPAVSEPDGRRDGPSGPSGPAVQAAPAARPARPARRELPGPPAQLVRPCPTAGTVSPTGGGGQVGLLLISKFVKPGTINTVGYFNHFSLLRSIEQLFSIDETGYASAPTTPTFDTTVYTAFSG